MPVVFFQIIDCFEVPVKVGSGIIPGVAWIMDVLVGPKIRKKHLARVGVDVRECIEDVSDSSRGVSINLLGNNTRVAYVRSSVGINEGGYFRPYMPL
jgi:hypothetical protein